ncbi:MAG: efflux RND transporter periplasmic adaptor subunit [Bacteroides sp.]|nr:efflux RND transporter periplasmic adaptor subunit [Bacteroides sp.]
MKYLSFTAVICAMFLTACSAKEKQQDEVAPIRVTTSVVTNSSVNTGKMYSGVIEESSGTALSFKVPGTIMSLSVTEGQRVAKGQLIGVLDGASLQSNYEIAKAALATAQDTYDRMKQLHDANSIPEMKWVEVQNALKSAQSACDITKNTLGDTHLYAPFSGIVSEKYADVGATATPGVPVVKLVEISPVKASISVPENKIGEFQKGSLANITVNASGNISVDGTLTEKGVAADPLSRTYSVKFTASNPDGKLLPGMLCNVSLKSPESKDAIVIPIGAVLLDHNNQSFVWTVKNGKAEKRLLTLGEYIADGVVVTSGLSDGDEIITTGQQKVSNGMSVTSINK